MRTLQELHDDIIANGSKEAELTAGQLDEVAGGLTYSNPCGGLHDTYDSNACVSDCR